MGVFVSDFNWICGCLTVRSEKIPTKHLVVPMILSIARFYRKRQIHRDTELALVSSVCMGCLSSMWLSSSLQLFPPSHLSFNLTSSEENTMGKMKAN
jgi:hypothetical protein